MAPVSMTATTTLLLPVTPYFGFLENGIYKIAGEN
jgi:hypothetical protein